MIRYWRCQAERNLKRFWTQARCEVKPSGGGGRRTAGSGVVCGGHIGRTAGVHGFRMSAKQRAGVGLAVSIASALVLVAPQAAFASTAPAYALIDVGTFGGPQAGLNIPGYPLTSHGTVLGAADTTIADGDYPNFNPFIVGFADPTLVHAFAWHAGKLKDLGALPGNNSSAVFQVNGNGVGVGMSETAVTDPYTGWPSDNAVMFKDGRVIDLGTLPGGYESQAIAINNRGQVAGFAQNGVVDPFSILGWGTETRAFIWQNGRMQDLGTLGGPDADMAEMNARGQIAGDSYTNNTPNSTGVGGLCPPSGVPTTDPYLWTDGHMRDLGTLGGTASLTNWLNDRGEVVGQDYLAGNQACHPFLWDGRRLRDLGTFGGDQGDANYINDAGVVVGWALLPGDNTAHAFQWRNGVMTDLTGSSTPACTVADRVNSRDQVVGETCAEDDALLWDSGRQYDLNTLVPPSDVHLTHAASINDRGQIVALGQLPNGNQHIFLLNPVGDKSDNSIPAFSRDVRTRSNPRGPHFLRVWTATDQRSEARPPGAVKHSVGGPLSSPPGLRGRICSVPGPRGQRACRGGWSPGRSRRPDPVRVSRNAR
jgi:probable HAF family extracellular repeat protein